MKLMTEAARNCSIRFPELGFPVFPTTSRVAVGLSNTGK
jgi:hypothetical protein